MQILLDSTGQHCGINTSPVRNVIRLCFSYLPVECHKNISTQHSSEQQQRNSRELHPTFTQRKAFFQFISTCVQRQREPLWVTGTTLLPETTSQARLEGPGKENQRKWECRSSPRSRKQKTTKMVLIILKLHPKMDPKLMWQFSTTYQLMDFQPELHCQLTNP